MSVEEHRMQCKARDDFDKLTIGRPPHIKIIITNIETRCRKEGLDRLSCSIQIINKLADILEGKL